MALWIATIQLKDLFTHEDISPEEAQVLGQQVATRLKHCPIFYNKIIIREFETVTDQDDFNAVLSDCYNYCDFQRIWIA